MSWKYLETNWIRRTTTVSELSEHDVPQIREQPTQLQGTLRELYGLAHDEAEKDAAAFCRTL